MAINFVAVMFAAAAGLLIGGVWNSHLLFGGLRARLLAGNSGAKVSGRPSPWRLLAELGRLLVTAAILALFVAPAAHGNWIVAAHLGLLFWLGFQAMFLAGAMIWEGMAPRLYAIHAGDALVKMLAMSVIVGVWR